MAKYHITVKGEPGLCRATSKPCPLGGEADHYPTKQDAQEAYEALNKGATFNVTYNRTGEAISPDLKEFIREKFDGFNRLRKTNMGEFAEANSGLVPLLADAEFLFHDDDGNVHEVEAIDFGSVRVFKNGKVETAERTFIVDRRKLASYGEDLNAELINKGDGIHEAAAKVWSSVGLSDLPKAPPTQKSDFYVLVNGVKRGVSVKSFVGSPPTIANSSGANSATVRVKVAMDVEEAKSFAERVNSETSASVRLAMLREANLDFENSDSSLPEVFGENIKTVAELERKDANTLERNYSSAITRFYLGDKTLTEEEKDSLRTISNHYARGMNAGTPYVPEENDVELFLIQNSDGTSELHTPKNSNMTLVLEEASSGYRKTQLGKINVEENNGEAFFAITFSAGFRTVPNVSRRATF